MNLAAGGKMSRRRDRLSMSGILLLETLAVLLVAREAGVGDNSPKALEQTQQNENLLGSGGEPDRGKKG